MNKITYVNLEVVSDVQRKEMMSRTEADLSNYLEKVKPIIEAVAENGDEALIDYISKLDNASLTIDQLKVSEKEFNEAFKMVDKEVIEAIEYGVENIRTFHEAQMPEEMWMKEIRPGAFAGERVTPIENVALYVPRGKGSFPSTAMMLAVPAVVAKVPNAFLITPPGPDGTVDAGTLVATKVAGLNSVFKSGGALAAAAVAYGTNIIPKADRILGPGSPWLMAAKRLLVGKLDPGISAGPSEAIVLADETADPRLAALDLLIEAEHGPDSSAYLVTNSARVVDETKRWLKTFWDQMCPQRQEFSKAVLCGGKGGIVYADNMEKAIDFVNEYAPEHLEILSGEPMKYLGQIINASEILLGSHTPMSIANFVLGPNAVLPTAFGARTISALSVHDFLKRSSLGYVTSKGYGDLAEMGHRIATYEGFDAHARSLSDLRFPEQLKKNEEV